jgi:signal transduction histidine kinase/ligand-binding sensor domain-containing protein
MKICIPFFLLFLIYTNLFPQYSEYHFENLTSSEGLSQNSVLFIFQDSRNFLWFGTYDGVNRFDGYTFKVFKNDINDTNTISGQRFASVCEDSSGNLWFGSLDGGLSKYNRLKNTFIRYVHNKLNPDGLSSNYIKDLLIDKNGELWIATQNGLDKFDSKTNKFLHFKNDSKNSNTISSNLIAGLGEDDNGNLWIGTGCGVDRFDKKSKRFYHYLKHDFIKNSHKSFIFDNSGKLWIAAESGLYEFDGKRDEFIRHINTFRGKENQAIRTFMKDNLGIFWIEYYSGGLFNFNKENGLFTLFRANQVENINIQNIFVHSIFQDKSGIFWLGTDVYGILKLDFRKSQFVNFSYRLNNKNSLSSNNVHSLAEDSDGFIWVGTYGGGLNRVNINNGSVEKFLHNEKDKNSLISNRMHSLLMDNNSMLWIGTSEGIDRFNIKTKRFIRSDEFSTIKGHSVSTLAKTKSGEIWIGTYDNGFYIYNNQNNTLENFDADSNNPQSLSNSTIRNIYEDSKGILWVCTDDGLNIFNRRKNSFYTLRNIPGDPRSLSSNIVLNIFEDKNGGVWVGTADGLNKLVWNGNNINEIRFERFNLKNGLPNNHIQSILEDDSGNLWISTNKGLSKFNPVTKVFINYTSDDGLPGDEFYVNCYCNRKRTGELLFGSNEGFCVFKPNKIIEDKNRPKVVMTDFKIFNQSVNVGDYFNERIVLTKEISEADQINLSYKNSIISFEYAALSYAAPKKNKFAYFMEGLESKWNYVGNRRFATYVNLPPGEYTFRVIASNSSGLWNLKGVAIKIIVFPPYWQMWWFRLLVGCVVLAFIFLIFKVRVANIEKSRNQLKTFNEQLSNEIKEKNQKEKELREAKEEAEKSDKLKTEFLAQMSHEIRTPINAILSFTSLLKEEVSDKIPEDLGQSFVIIDAASNRLIRTIDLILNMSQLQTDTYECNYREFDIYKTILDGLIKQYKNIAKEKGIEINLHKQTENTSIFADEYTVGQIFENLLNNAIKFTKKGKVELLVTRNLQEKLTVEVADTGEGISEEFLPNLFKPFTQEEGGYTRRYEGNGLGLALVKKYIELNGAVISVKSKKGQGTTFSIIFDKENTIK